MTVEEAVVETRALAPLQAHPQKKYHRSCRDSYAVTGRIPCGCMIWQKNMRLFRVSIIRN